MLLKSKMTVVGANGTQGEIVQKTLGVIGKVRFSLESGGQALGSINAEDWQEWDFSIQDAAGAEMARISKTWAGWAKRGSRRPTTTSYRFTGRLRSRCVPSRSRPR
jgi:hypothetical protein